MGNRLLEKVPVLQGRARQRAPQLLGLVPPQPWAEVAGVGEEPQ